MLKEETVHGDLGKSTIVTSYWNQIATFTKEAILLNGHPIGLLMTRSVIVYRKAK